MEQEKVEKTEVQNHERNQTIIIQQGPPRSNGIGTDGFVLALIGFLFFWVPLVGWIAWLLGLILSACGMFKKPRGLAIAGLVISVFSLIVWVQLVEFEYY